MAFVGFKKKCDIVEMRRNEREKEKEHVGRTRKIEIADHILNRGLQFVMASEIGKGGCLADGNLRGDTEQTPAKRESPRELRSRVLGEVWKE
jgi:hypothetical protein